MPLQIGLEVNGAADYVTGVHVWFPGAVSGVPIVHSIGIHPPHLTRRRLDLSESRGALRGHHGLPCLGQRQ